MKKKNEDTIRKDMEKAQALIRAKKFDDARAILITIDDPTAEKWLAKLNQTPSSSINPATNIGQAKIVGKKKSRWTWRTWLTVVAAFLFLCCGCFLFIVIGEQLGFIPDSTEYAATRTLRAEATGRFLTRNAPTATITHTPSATFTASATATETFTPTVTFTPSITPTATITNTPAPLPTSTNTLRPAPTITPQPPTALPAPTAAPARTFYVSGDFARIRDCASTDCEQVNLFQRGQSLQVVGEVQGVEANGSSLWYLLADGNYVHSSTVSQTAPAAPVQSSNNTNTGGSGGGGGFTSGPGNCATAVASGMTAQQAAAAGLDRDGDGVACYGD